MNYKGKKVKSQEDLGNGWLRLTFDDGSTLTCLAAPTEEAEEKTSKKGSKAEEDDDDEDEDDEEEEKPAKKTSKKVADEDDEDEDEDDEDTKKPAKKASKDDEDDEEDDDEEGATIDLDELSKMKIDPLKEWCEENLDLSKKQTKELAAFGKKQEVIDWIEENFMEADESSDDDDDED